MIWRALTLLSAAALGTTLGHWWSDRELPTEFIRADVVNNEVRPGDDLLVQFKVNRRRSCAFSGNRILVDHANVRYVLPSIEFKSAPGPLGDDSYISPVHMPDALAPGQATYRYQGAYYCNPLHAIWPIVPTPVVVKFDVLSK